MSDTARSADTGNGGTSSRQSGRKSVGGMGMSDDGFEFETWEELEAGLKDYAAKKIAQKIAKQVIDEWLSRPLSVTRGLVRESESWEDF